MASLESLKLKPLSVAVAMLLVTPISLMAAEPNQSKEVKEQPSENNTQSDNSDDQTLPTVNVKSSKQNAPSDGYQATKTRIGKVLQDPHDVPQAITTVTKNLMHDQQVGSLREALRNVSGLTFNAAEGGRSGDNMMLRGFYTFGDIYLDGIRDTAQYNRETFNLEQVDVLRGSVAMLFGRGQAGGVINQVSKTAKLNDENKITGSLGEYDYHQFTGDFNKQLTDTAAIRVNVMDRSEETYRKNPANGDHPELDRKGIAVSFGAGIGTDNEFFLNHIYTQTRDVPDYGIRFTNGRITKQYSDSTFWGGDQNYDNSDTRITTASFNHKFSEDTQWRTQLRSADYQRSFWAKTPGVVTAGIISAPNANLTGNDNVVRTLDYETVTLQSDLNTTLQLLGMKHQLLGGVEYLHENSALYRTTVNEGTAANPFLANAKPGTNFTKFTSDSYAVYAQDTIEFIPQWDLLLGIRRDEMDADYTNATTRPKLDYGELSYRAGLSWHQTETSHYYFSYSDSFSPTADLYQLTTVALAPERSKTAELGAKWLFFDGDLAFRSAAYRTVKDWERNTDLAADTAPLLTRKRRTDGVEFELAGRITDHWEVFSGLAFMDARILKTAVNNDGSDAGTAPDAADVRFEGKRARNTPPVTFNMWTTYKFAGNWKVGGGFESKGARLGYSPSAQAGPFINGKFTPNILPGYTRWDVMLAYEEQKWAVRLNVKNLFDKEYYDSLYDNGAFAVPGNRRQAIITTEFKF